VRLESYAVTAAPRPQIGAGESLLADRLDSSCAPHNLGPGLCRREARHAPPPDETRHGARDVQAGVLVGSYLRGQWKPRRPRVATPTATCSTAAHAPVARWRITPRWTVFVTRSVGSREATARVAVPGICTFTPLSSSFHTLLSYLGTLWGGEELHFNRRRCTSRTRPRPAGPSRPPI
jgi:hypothetical protein